MSAPGKLRLSYTGSEITNLGTIARRHNSNVRIPDYCVSGVSGSLPQYVVNWNAYNLRGTARMTFRDGYIRGYNRLRFDSDREQAVLTNSAIILYRIESEYVFDEEDQS